MAFELNSIADFLLTRGFFRNLRNYKEDHAAVVYIGSTAGMIGDCECKYIFVEKE